MSYQQFHISVNMSDVKYATNETKDEEHFVTDNSVVNAPSYVNLLKCGKNLLKNIDDMYERA